MVIDTCFWHGWEPELPGDYWACGECWHVWRTAEDFNRDLVAVAPEMTGLEPLQTPACPLCCHSW